MTYSVEVIENVEVPAVKEPIKLNLYQKISAVMQDVSYLQKDDKIEFKTTKYKAISEEKVTSAVRASLIKYGLVILPIEQNHSREGSLSAVDTRYKIVDIDTGQHEIIVSSGTGADTQDKGVGKAMTYSYKYLLLRTFAIPTGEDPDKVSSAELDERTKTGDSPTNFSGKQASEKQLNLVTSLLKKKVTEKWSFDTLYQNLKSKLETDLEMEKWTSSEASKAIAILQAKPESKGA